MVFVVIEVKEDGVLLKSGKFLPCGLVVWSTGVSPVEFTAQLPFKKNSIGQVDIRSHLIEFVVIYAPTVAVWGLVS